MGRSAYFRVNLKIKLKTLCKAYYMVPSHRTSLMVAAFIILERGNYLQEWMCKSMPCSELQVVQHGLKGGYTWREDGSDLES